MYKSVEIKEPKGKGLDSIYEFFIVVAEKCIELLGKGSSVEEVHSCIRQFNALAFAKSKIVNIVEKIRENNSDFKVALGNEIYLVDERTPKQKHYHFILIAKDALGHKAIRELSSQAWFYSYKNGRIEWPSTLKSELKQIIEKYKGHVIATSACLGGELSNNVLAYSLA